MRSEPAVPRRPSRSAVVVLLLPIALVIGWFAVKTSVRSHVDGVIQGTVGKPLPAFRLADLGGREWTAERLRGKPAVLHFVRSHCEVCDAEAADYREFERGAGPTFTVLHVATDRVAGFAEADAQASIRAHAFAAPVLLADAAFLDAFHSVAWSKVTPVTYVVDSGGVVQRALRGRQTLAVLQEALAAVR
jgi:peroxiredoxin